MQNKIYADYLHKDVQQKASELSLGCKNRKEILENIFLYVRDQIKFKFTANGDLVAASGIIKLGYGVCNNKATLFLALCKAVGIPARIHFSSIDKEIQHGIFPKFFFKRIPKNLSHSWVEVEYRGEWRRIDAFINDKMFYQSGKCLLRKENRKIGYSISCQKVKSDIELDLQNEKFVQMDAVTDDHGIYDDPGEYYITDLYANRPSFIILFVYRIVRLIANNRVREIREQALSC